MRADESLRSMLILILVIVTAVGFQGRGHDRQGDRRSDRGPRVLSYGLVLLAGLFCVAAVVLGIHARVSKS